MFYITRMLKNNYICSIALILIIALQTCIMWICNISKSDLFIDEYYTFNFANSNYAPILKGDFKDYNYWLTSNYWWKLLTVQAGEEFNYGAVYYNTARDVHPPLYYFIVHTVYSFLPDIWNPDLAVIVNLVLFVATEILMYFICDKLYNNKVWAVFCCTVYGFSMGAINSFVLIRMYGLLIFWSILYFWLVLKYNDGFERKWLAGLYVINVAGFLTHYFFIVFATGMFFLLAYIMYKKNRLSCLKELFVIDLFSIASCVGLFPVCIEHIFGHGANSYRGQQAFQAIFASIETDLLLTNIVYFILNVNVVLFLLFSLTLSCIENRGIGSIKNIFSIDVEKNVLIKQLLVTVLLMLVIISRICPFTEMRYFYFLFPFICIIAVAIIKDLFFQGKASKFFYSCLCSIFIVVEVANIYKFKEIAPFLTGDELTGQISREWLKDNKIEKCIILLKDEDVCFLLYSMNILKNAEKTYIAVKGDNIDIDRKVNEKYLVFIDGETNKEKCLQMLADRYKLIAFANNERSRFVDAFLCVAENKR